MATFKHRTREEWQEIATSQDAVKRGELNSIIRSTGQDPITYMTWSLAQRIDYVMKLQDQEGGKAAPEPAAEAPAAEEPPKKAKAKANGDVGPTPAGGEEFKKLQARIDSLEKSLEKALAMQQKLVADTQLMVRVLVLSNPEAKANLEDEGCQSLYGKLAYNPGN